MPDIGDFIRRSRRSAKIAIAAPGTPGDFRRSRRSAHKIAFRKFHGHTANSRGSQFSRALAGFPSEKQGITHSPCCIKFYEPTSSSMHSDCVVYAKKKKILSVSHSVKHFLLHLGDTSDSALRTLNRDNFLLKCQKLLPVRNWKG